MRRLVIGVDEKHRRPIMPDTVADVAPCRLQLALHATWTKAARQGCQIYICNGWVGFELPQHFPPCSLAVAFVE